MSENMKSRVIDKVRSLFAKTTERGASEAEAATAVAMAQRLMASYHLSEEDLAHEPADDYAAVDDAKFGEYRSYVGRVVYAWEGSLAMFVSGFVGAPCYIDNAVRVVRRGEIVQLDENGCTKNGKSIVFYGVAEDAIMASDIYDELRMLIASMAVAKWGGCYKGDGGMYAQGFVVGLYEKHKKADEQARIEASTSTTSMVLVARRNDLIQYKRDRAKSWLAIEKGIKLRNKRSAGGANGSSSAWGSGRSDGAATDVNRSRARKIGA